MKELGEDVNLERNPELVLTRSPKDRFSSKETKVLAILVQAVWQERLRMLSARDFQGKEVLISPELSRSFKTLPYTEFMYPDGDPGLAVPVEDDGPVSEQLSLITTQLDLGEMLNFEGLVLDLRYRGAEDITVLASFLPAGRGDRPVVRERLKVREVAMLEVPIVNLAASVDSLITLDAHSPATAWFCLKHKLPVLEVTAKPLLIAEVRGEGLLEKDCVVVTPDDGAKTAGVELAEEIGAEIVGGSKDKTTGRTEISFPSNLREIVGGKTVLVFEDMISTGGTILDTINKLQDAGAELVVILSTHAIFAGEALLRLGHVEGSRIITTDSRESQVKLRSVANITVVPVVHRLLEVAKLDQQGFNPWSDEGRKQLRSLGLDLAPWLRGVNRGSN